MCFSENSYTMFIINRAVLKKILLKYCSPLWIFLPSCDTPKSSRNEGKNSHEKFSPCLLTTNTLSCHWPDIHNLQHCKACQWHVAIKPGKCDTCWHKVQNIQMKSSKYSYESLAGDWFSWQYWKPPWQGPPRLRRRPHIAEKKTDPGIRPLRRYHPILGCGINGYE